MENKTPERLTLTTNLVSALIQYLGAKPYNEVAPLLNGIHSQIAPQLPPPQAEESASGESQEKSNNNQ